MKASPLVFESALWALTIALSLNIGAVIGVSCLPRKKLCAALMAFGGGAFLFALSVEIFGRTLHEAKKQHSRDQVWVMESSAILGGCIFAGLNRLLNSRGADLRKRSLAKVRFVRMRKLFIRRLVGRMRKLKIFSDLTPAEVSELVLSSMEKMWFPRGDVVLEPTSALFNIYFIVSGRVSFESVEHQPPAFERFELGAYQIFGEMLGRRATALAPTKLLKLPAEDLARLMENSATVREAMAASCLRRACWPHLDRPLQRPEQTSLQIFRIKEKILKKAKMGSLDAQCICFGKVEVFQSGFARQIFNATQILRRSDLANPDGPVEVTALELTAVLWLPTPELQTLATLATKPRLSPCLSDACGISGTRDVSIERLVNDNQGLVSPPALTTEVESLSASDLESGMPALDDCEFERSASLESIHKECGWLEHMSEVADDASVGSFRSEVCALQSNRLVSDCELEERDLLLKPLGRKMSKTGIPSKDGRSQSEESVASRELEAEHAEHSNAAVMVWLGILIDSIPESVVIGILVNRAGGSLSGVLPFSVGLFMSNLPESMCSSGLMRAHGMRTRTILLMWSLISLATVIGSVIGALAFPPGSDQEASTRTLVAGVEGLAGGAMLTMIAQTMMPEAFEQGGDVIGLSCLAGFLCALSSKLLPV